MRNFNKTIEAFMKCVEWAQQGKTFIFVHPKFVAIDMKTWDKLKRERLPSMTFYDEAGEISDEQLKEIDKILEKRK